jgi:hypothetical protein
MPGAGQHRPPLRLGVDGRGADGGELSEGAVNGARPGGAALGAQSGRELLGGEGAVVAEGPEDAGGGSRVGQLGQGAVVGAAGVPPPPVRTLPIQEVVPGLRRGPFPTLKRSTTSSAASTARPERRGRPMARAGSPALRPPAR